MGYTVYKLTGGAAMQQCEYCAQKLSTNEIGISLRLLGKDGHKLLCRSCLAKEFHVDVEIIDKKIQQYRELGCPLFV